MDLKDYNLKAIFCDISDEEFAILSPHVSIPKSLWNLSKDKRTKRARMALNSFCRVFSKGLNVSKEGTISVNEKYFPNGEEMAIIYHSLINANHQRSLLKIFELFINFQNRKLMKQIVPSLMDDEQFENLQPLGGNNTDQKWFSLYIGKY